MSNRKYEVFEVNHTPGSTMSGGGTAFLLIRLSDGVLAKKAEGRVIDIIELARSLNGER